LDYDYTTGTKYLDLIGTIYSDTIKAIRNEKI